ncbi:MAG TPA: DUF1207 domain-containing protein [Gemmatimonadaceae bacterium]|nr:DUF1207 domain-containing protein [Gemmatimonadaceae bacterium]
MKNGTRCGFANVISVLAFAGATASSLRAQEPFRSRCGAGAHVDERRGTVPLPQGTLLCPLVADPKFEQTFVSYLRGDFATLADTSSTLDTNIGAVGLGDSFGLLRFAGAGAGGQVQIDLVGAIFAQFNLDTPSFDLINADYLVGLPITYRLHGFSARARVYHQSSHLGDEYLLAQNPERENLSFESAELLLSQEVGPLRVYAAGEKFFRARPVDLTEYLGHAGIEYRPPAFGAGRLVAALDAKVLEDANNEYRWALSARAGIEVARIPSPGHPPRIVSLLATWYDGLAPYGQFYRDNIRFVGVGLHFAH